MVEYFWVHFLNPFSPLPCSVCNRCDNYYVPRVILVERFCHHSREFDSLRSHSFRDVLPSLHLS